MGAQLDRPPWSLKGWYLLLQDLMTLFLLWKVRSEFLALLRGLMQKMLPGGKRLPDGVMPVEEWPMQFL